MFRSVFKAQSHCPVLKVMYYYVSHSYVLPNVCPVSGALGFTRFLVGVHYALLGLSTYNPL
jgi:hypothetical protein